MSTKPTIFALLAVLVVGIAIAGPSLASGIFAHSEGPAVTPTIAELSSLQDGSTPTPLLVAEPTFTPEPTATPTIINTPTSIPSPTATSTSLPTATDTPTPPPTPSPTATSLPTATFTPVPTATPESGIKYVVIFSIDGMRPDAFEQADTPTMDGLKARGVYCPCAQTVLNSITLIGHASMLTGMTPEKHGILWGLPYIGWPGMNGPSLCSEAHDAGLSTAMVFGKEKMNYLVLPNSVDKLFGENAYDTEIRDRAIEIIEEGMPNVFFIHFPDTDRVGHAYGWMSSNQLYAITFADSMISEIMAALESGGYLQNTLIIITADHGGHDFGHGDDSPEDRTIPWLAAGPGVPPGVTLNRPINIEDTAATALYALELPVPERWDGQPVLEVFE